MKRNITLAFLTTPEIAEKIKSLSEKENRTKSQVIDFLLREALKKRERKK